ncbi:membrane-associated phospholipid phosphatase [Duganella sp. FT80W]|uniref:Membrane-associated phospholipid phosphatase n=1 Tax=Duganella guangzhouensis TaxID=2666084 RepID=A0A6I2KZY6_9BURK|nr:phosphatase PAP2 family protein [Duganella guangzhouensis]MRW90044.1 membrane-associated phospholipid phosphatase [Duganella guangzhouensis]
MMWWHWLSVIGSVAVTGPIGIVIMVWLLTGKSWRLSIIWAALYGAGMALVVASKLAFIGWGIGVASLQFAGFSGHAMRAAAVFPVLGFLLTRSLPSWQRHLGPAVGVVLSVLIALSRIYTWSHSPSEAYTGCLLGLAVAFAFIWYASAERDLTFSRMLVMLCLPVLVVAPQFKPVPTERWITKAALYLSGRDQPYTSAIWYGPRSRLR